LGHPLAEGVHHAADLLGHLGVGEFLHDLLADFEYALLSWALEQAEGSQARAAKILGIARSTFQYRWNKAQAGR